MNKQIYEYYTRVEQEFDDDDDIVQVNESDCQHDLFVIDGIATCMNCGQMQYSTLVNDFNDSQGRQIVYRPYVRLKYFRDILRRLNGYFYTTMKNTEDIINKLQESPNIKQVRD